MLNSDTDNVKTSSNDGFHTLIVYQGQGQIFVSSVQKLLHSQQNKIHYVFDVKQTSKTKT